MSGEVANTESEGLNNEPKIEYIPPEEFHGWVAQTMEERFRQILGEAQFSAEMLTNPDPRYTSSHPLHLRSLNGQIQRLGQATDIITKILWRGPGNYPVDDTRDLRPIIDLEQTATMMETERRAKTNSQNLPKPPQAK